MIVWQEPPPFIQYMEEAETLGRASYLAGVCTGMNMISTDQPALQEMLGDFERRSVMARTDGPVLNNSFQAGVDRERAAVALMLDLGPDDGSEGRQRREDQAAEYIGNGCAELTLDYPEVFAITAAADAD